MAARYHLATRHGHPLADRKGFVHVHRIVLYEALGSGPQRCHWCDREIEWHPQEARDRVEVDHLDNDGRNNTLSNLVASCHRCNILRSREDLIADDEPFVLDRHGWRHRAVIRTCETCGNDFPHLAADKRPSRGRFCSRSCARKAPRRKEPQ